MEKKLEENIISCSRCGLCMDVCPVYKAKQTETSVSRGKFLQLLGLIRGDLKYDKKIAYNLDLCLACKKCKKACPSDIDAVEIFSKIKAEYQTPFEKFLYSSFVFKMKMLALKILYKVKYPFGKVVRKNKSQKKANEKIAYFKGCATSAMGNFFFIPKQFKKEKFSCCALPFYLKGRLDLYEKYKKKNLKIMEKYDKVVFDCATCYDTVLAYDGVEKSKLVYFTDFYKTEKLSLKAPLKVTFHKPCHLGDEKFAEIKEILKGIENLEFVEYPEMAECCGFGGDFFTRHFKSASYLSLKKAENILKTDADIVLTTCPICLWGLKFGLKAKMANIKAYDLMDFFYRFT